MRRLVADTVLAGLVTAWRFAGVPTNLSASLTNAITDGVVREPSAFSITRGVLPSITLTQELVVPRSTPMTCPLAVLIWGKVELEVPCP